MTTILLLALGSAIFPTLLAAAAVILSRENPSRLLVSFWLGGIVTSVALGLVIIALFGSHAASLSKAGSGLSPLHLMVFGVLVILVALLLGTTRGQGIVDGWRARRPHRNADEDPARTPWAERMLDRGTAGIAVCAGAVLNLPGPFYLLALGDISQGHYGPLTAFLLVVGFNLIMLLMIEIPLIGFRFDPEETDRLVGRLSEWLNRNGMRIVAVIAMVWGLSMVYKGAAGLVNPERSKAADTVTRKLTLGPAGRDQELRKSYSDTSNC